MANINQILFPDDTAGTEKYLFIETDDGNQYIPLDRLAGISFEPSIRDSGDWDDDGLLNDDELKKYFTDPMKADTDGDGWNDKEEISQFDPGNTVDPGFPHGIYPRQILC